MESESESERIERALLEWQRYFEELKIDPGDMVLGFECGVCNCVTPVSLNDWDQPICRECGTLCSDRVRELLEHAERVTKIPLKKWLKSDS